MYKNVKGYQYVGSPEMVKRDIIQKQELQRAGLQTGSKETSNRAYYKDKV
jgi:hypothetical protein